MGIESVLIIIAIILIAFIITFKGVRRITIYEYEKGLRYYKGKFVRILDSGQYWFFPARTTINKIDIRPSFVSITGQEVLSSDGVTLKVSIAANYEIEDPNVAINKVQDFRQTLYLELQLALREIISDNSIDEIMSKRSDISNKLMEKTEKKAEAIGLKLISADLKDIMFPGALKQMFAQVVNARQEGLAALEKARGETAALRNLANAAKMLDSNPNLLQLRLFQTISQSSGNTFMLGIPSGTTVLPIKSDNTGGKGGNEIDDIDPIES